MSLVPVIEVRSWHKGVPGTLSDRMFGPLPDACAVHAFFSTLLARGWKFVRRSDHTAYVFETPNAIYEVFANQVDDTTIHEALASIESITND